MIPLVIESLRLDHAEIDKNIQQEKLPEPEDRDGTYKDVVMEDSLPRNTEEGVHILMQYKIVAAYDNLRSETWTVAYVINSKGDTEYTVC